MLSPCPEGKQRRSRRRARGKENALKRTLANFIGEKRLRTTDKYRGWIQPIIRVQGTRLSASETAESTKRVHLEAFPQELMNLLNEVVSHEAKRVQLSQVLYIDYQQATIDTRIADNPATHTLFCLLALLCVAGAEEPLEVGDALPPLLAEPPGLLLPAMGVEVGAFAASVVPT